MSLYPPPRDIRTEVFVQLSGGLGEPLYRVRSCTGLATTNCAHGGPGNRYLYITGSETNTVLRAEMPWPGKPMYSHMA